MNEDTALNKVIKVMVRGYFSCNKRAISYGEREDSKHQLQMNTKEYKK